MTGVWVTIAALAFATAALKLAGPLLLGGRPLPAGAMSVIELLRRRCSPRSWSSRRSAKGAR